MVEGTVRALLDEVAEQPEVLQRFSKGRFPRAGKGALFVGAGDSYAAALAGFFSSGGRCSAVDPYVLASNPEFADGADVYFVSVSGRTASNTRAVKKVQGHARRTTALTAVDRGPLAQLTNRVVGLPMSYQPRTPGILSFSLSLLAVLKILQVEDSCDFTRALDEARKDRIRLADGEGTTYYLGNSLAYPVSLYGAAKSHEILGAKAHAEFLEEFSHLELFSLVKPDAVNCFSCFDPADLAGKLSKNLGERGYDCHAVRSWGRSPTEKIFHAVFVAQLSVLQAAIHRGVTAPRFLSSRGALEASDAMIY